MLQKKILDIDAQLVPIALPAGPDAGGTEATQVSDILQEQDDHGLSMEAVVGAAIEIDDVPAEVGGAPVGASKPFGNTPGKHVGQ